MGSRASRQSKQESERKETLKQLATHSKKSKLLGLRDMIQQSKRNLQNAQKDSDYAVVQQDTRVVQSGSVLIDTAIAQLDRRGKNLIKADLIAVVLTLKPEYITMLESLQTRFTVEDLNELIRNIVYDPDEISQKLGLHIDCKTDLTRTLENNSQRQLQLNVPNAKKELLSNLSSKSTSYTLQPATGLTWSVDEKTDIFTDPTFQAPTKPSKFSYDIRVRDVDII